MKSAILMFIVTAAGTAAVVKAQSQGSCADLAGLELDGVAITKAELVPAGTTVPPPYPGAPANGPLPAHCRVDGVINGRKGVDGLEFGIGFAIALPEGSAWNGDFMMQGGGGGNGVVAYPTGASYAGDTPALSRGFAVASTDTGDKSKTGAFAFSFMRDQQAYLDFAFLANAEVAGVAKQIIAHYYAKPAAYSYFVGCSTGGREGMILSQRYPRCGVRGVRTAHAGPSLTGRSRQDASVCQPHLWRQHGSSAQILDGVAGAWHTAELQFCFDNTKRCEQGTGNTPEAQALAKRMASSWAAFAATGNPSIPGLKWASTDPETNKTMVWDNECRMVDDPDGEARKIISA
jgi:hypothetical protein